MNRTLHSIYNLWLINNHKIPYDNEITVYIYVTVTVIRVSVR